MGGTGNPSGSLRGLGYAGHPNTSVVPPPPPRDWLFFAQKVKIPLLVSFKKNEKTFHRYGLANATALGAFEEAALGAGLVLPRAGGGGVVR